MKIHVLIAVVLVFILGFSLGTGIKYLYETKSFQPYAWSEESLPIIANCYGTDFSEMQFRRAMKFWERKGHKFGFYEHNPPEELCENEYLDGFIILRKGGRFDHDSGVLAKTRRYTRLTSVFAAVITYRPGSQNLEWINEHELGHALGFAHFEADGHIMHPLFHKMDGKFWVP